MPNLDKKLVDLIDTQLEVFADSIETYKATLILDDTRLHSTAIEGVKQAYEHVVMSIKNEGGFLPSGVYSLLMDRIPRTYDAFKRMAHNNCNKTIRCGLLLSRVKFCQKSLKRAMGSLQPKHTLQVVR